MMNMKNQMRGIALLLFGILLAVIGVAMANTLPGNYPGFFGVVGGLIGACGLAFTFIKNE